MAARTQARIAKMVVEFQKKYTDAAAGDKEGVLSVLGNRLVEELRPSNRPLLIRAITIKPLSEALWAHVGADDEGDDSIANYSD